MRVAKAAPLWNYQEQRGTHQHSKRRNSALARLTLRPADLTAAALFLASLHREPPGAAGETGATKTGSAWVRAFSAAGPPAIAGKLSAGR